MNPEWQTGTLELCRYRGRDRQRHRVRVRESTRDAYKVTAHHPPAGWQEQWEKAVDIDRQCRVRSGDLAFGAAVSVKSGR
jgi:hypothetical protein